MTYFDPASSMVLILHENGEPEGAGFLVSRRHILTCCHVYDKVQKNRRIRVEFPLLKDRPRLQVLERHRYPVRKNPSPAEIHDIVLLELMPGDQLPADAAPALVSQLLENRLSSISVEMYGFPEDMNRDHWIRGTVRRRVGDARIQIDHDPGARTAMPGFSGGMVWSPDKGEIVGMVTDIYWNPEKPKALATYMMPAADLARVLREVRSNTPPLLCYRIDRMDQVQAIRRLLPKPEPFGKTGPILCILHGDEKQGHQKFWQCLGDYHWRKIIHAYSSAAADPKRFDIPWPRGVREFDLIRQDMVRELSNRIGVDESGNYNIISAALNRNTCDTPVLVYTWVTNEDWQVEGETILNNFLDFWKEWPGRPSSVPLVACLAVRYLRKRGKADRRMPFWKGLFGGRSDPEFNDDRIRNVLKTRHADKEIPELYGVKRTDVLLWIEEADVRPYCQQCGADPESVVEAIYTDEKIENVDDRIPMMDLAGALADRFFF